TLIIVASAPHARAAESARVIVQADKPGIPVPTTLHGLFFEDINYGADGGLYAELIQNRSFEDRQPLFAWSGDRNGRMVIETESPLNANNPHFLRIHVTQPGEHGFALANSGFDGIALRAGENYLFSAYARLRAGEARQLQVTLEDASGHALAEQPIGTLG